MEEMMMMKKQSSGLGSASASLGMHKESHTISKVKPKIRIIHIFAPEIIKTDVANFRELVQRLTGKPPPPSPGDHLQKGSTTAKKPRRRRRSLIPSSSSSPSPFPSPSSSTEEEEDRHRHNHNHNLQDTVAAKKAEMKIGVKEEEEEEEMMMMWNGANLNSTTTATTSSGGFLCGFADLDGIIQELGDFPLLHHPMDHAIHSQYSSSCLS